jgi:hypothetical protein
MTEAEELLAHAARCDRLAAACRDPAVAEKLRELAHDYWELAGEPTERRPSQCEKPAGRRDNRAQPRQVAR